MGLAMHENVGWVTAQYVQGGGLDGFKTVGRLSGPRIAHVTGYSCGRQARTA